MLEMQLDVVTTERERIDVLMQARAASRRSSSSSRTSRRSGSSRCSRSTRTTRTRYVALERCYRRLRQWLDLINTYERHIARRSIARRRSSSTARSRKVYADEVEDLDRAIDAYLNIVDLDDTNIPALEALVEALREAGRCGAGDRLHDARRRAHADSKQRVEMYYRIGKALDEKLGDRVAGAGALRDGARSRSGAPARRSAALRQIAIDSADWDRAARYLDQEQMQHAGAARSARKLLVELGKLRDEMLGEHDSAVLACELALRERRRQRGRGAAARRRVHRAASSGRRPSRSPRCSSSKAGKRERAEQHTLQNKLGKVARGARQGREGAQGLPARRTSSISPTRRRSAASPRCASGSKDWAGALTNFQKVLTALGEDETEAARRGLLQARLHQARAGPGQAGDQQLREGARRRRRAPRRRSKRWSASTPSLKDWKQVVAYKRQILDNVVDGDERFKMLVEIGDIWHDKEKNPPKAHRGARGGAGSRAGEPRAPPQAARSSTRRRRTGRG